MAARTRSGAALWLARGAMAVVFALVFAVFALVGLIVHLNAPPLRQLVTIAANGAFAQAVVGQVRLESVAHIDPSSVVVDKLTVREHDAGPVLLELERVRLHIEPQLLLLDWLFGDSTSALTLSRIRVRRARLALVFDAADAEPSLARALRARAPSKPRTKPAQKRSLALPVIELGRVELELDHPSLGSVRGELARVRGTVNITPEQTTLAVERFSVRLREPERFHTVGTGSFAAEFPGALSGKFHGFVRGIELDAAGWLAGAALRLDLAAARAGPEEMRALLPAWPLTAPLTASLNAQGELPNLDVKLGLHARDTSIDGKGTLALSEPQSAHLALNIADLDLGLFAATLPKTALDADGQVTIASAESGLTLDFQAKTEPGSFERELLPGTELQGRVDQRGFSGKLAFREGTGNVAAHLVFPRTGPIEVEASVRDFSLGNWPRYPGLPAARLSLQARAKVSDGIVRGELEGDVQQAKAGPAQLQSAHVNASFHGPLARWQALELDARVAGRVLQLGPLVFASAELSGHVRGDQARFELALANENGPRGSLAGTLELGAEPSFSQVEVAFELMESHLRARVAHANPARKTLELSEFALSGAAGELSGRLRLGPDSVEGELDARELDVGWLARVAGVSTLASRGKLNGHTSLALGKDVTRAHAQLSLSGFLNSKLALASSRIQLELDREAFQADLQAVDPALGALGGHVSAAIDGPALEARSWQRATGSAELNLNRLPLWPLGLMIPRSAGIESLAGYALASAKLQRTDPEALPDLFVQVGTEALKFKLTAAEPPVVLDQLALHASASVSGQSGHTALVLLVRDEHGDLVTASAALEPKLRELAADPTELWAKLERLPVQALIKLHERSMAWLPAPLLPAGLAGAVEASLSVQGTLRQPELVLVARGGGLMVAGADAEQAVDVTARASYVPESGQLDGNAEVVHAGQRVLNARMQGEVPFARTAPGSRIRSLNAAALVNGLPLALIPELAARKLEGQLHGSVQLEQRGAEVKQDVSLELLGLSVNGHAIGGGRLRVRADREGAHATLRIGSRDKYLRADLRGTAEQDAPWWSPAWGAFEGTASARGFDAAAVLPVLPGLVTRIGGEVDAEVAVRLKRSPSQGNDDWELGIQGDAALKQGSAHIDPLGLEIREVSARVRAEDAGALTRLHVEAIQAKARSSSINLRGDLGLTLKGIRVIDGDAQLALSNVPLTLQGVRRGNATGEAKAHLQRMPDHMLLVVNLPRLVVRLPTSASNGLIDLDQPSDIVVLQAEQRERDGEPGTLWKIQLKFGGGVRLTRSDLDLPLRGELDLDYQDDVKPSGTVEASPGGRITLFDRVFVIERGSLRFVPEEPTNPRIDLTASWLAPDGTTISVDVTGAAKEAHIVTRDDAGLEESQRFELLAGTSGSNESGESLDMRGTAAALAISQTFASLGINELLRESLGDVALRIGTTAENTATYTASVRLSNKLWLEGNFRPGMEQQGIDGSSRNAFSGTLDYRLTRNWSLRTELGTSGGALDLLWSHRY